MQFLVLHLFLADTVGFAFHMRNDNLCTRVFITA